MSNLFIAGLTQLTHFTRLITQWAGHSEGLQDDGLILAHPALCQLLFECQSPQLVSSVFSGRRVRSYNNKITSTLDWFVIGYCIAHCDTTSSWSVYLEDSLQYLQAFSSGLHYFHPPTAHTASLENTNLFICFPSLRFIVSPLHLLHCSLLHLPHCLFPLVHCPLHHHCPLLVHCLALLHPPAPIMHFLLHLVTVVKEAGSLTSIERIVC